MKTKKVLTNEDQIKKNIIFLAYQFLNIQEQKIISEYMTIQFEGWEEEVTNYLMGIEEQRAIIKEYSLYCPEVLIFVEDGSVDCVAASVGMEVNIYDKDNFIGCDEKQEKEFIETYGHPKTWNDMLEKRKSKGELKEVY